MTKELKFFKEVKLAAERDARVLKYEWENMQQISNLIFNNKNNDIPTRKLRLTKDQ